MPTTPEFETILYKTDGPVATITLNRPEHLNTIVPPMPDEVETAIGLAERDPAVKVIVLRGAGRAFSGGYDFGGGFQHWGDAMNTDGRWDPGKDFAVMIAGARQARTRNSWRSGAPPNPSSHRYTAGVLAAPVTMRCAPTSSSPATTPSSARPTPACGGPT